MPNDKNRICGIIIHDSKIGVTWNLTKIITNQFYLRGEVLMFKGKS
jgi:hypothetical protein